MRAVWKFPIPIDDHFTVVMPRGAKLLHAGLDTWSVPHVWAEVDTEAPGQARRLAIVGTGNPMTALPDHATHVGSFIEGAFMWHLYDETEEMF